MRSAGRPKGRRLARWSSSGSTARCMAGRSRPRSSTSSRRRERAVRRSVGYFAMDPAGRDGRMTDGARVFACISIDCECDKGAGWRSQALLLFAGTTEGIARRLAPLFAHPRARPTYLVSPELLRDEAAVDVLRAQRHTAELGTH